MADRPDRRELRKFGFVLVIVTAAVGSIWLWRDHRTTATVFYAISGYGLLSSVLFPPAVRPVFWLLQKFGHAVGWFNTRLILVLIFYLVFTPIGLLLRLFGKDLLNRKFDSQAPTYWIDKKKEPFDPKRYEKQF
ncbi:MAG: SxtJ family membrane protein [Candidatus Eisenbacteria bacterium]